MVHNLVEPGEQRRSIPLPGSEHLPVDRWRPANRSGPEPGYHPIMITLKRGRRPAHDPGVIYAFEKSADYAPYYSAVCRCGWSAEPVDAAYPDPHVEARMAAAARAHHPDADTTVAFPLDEPEGT
jgi:hypothetical protein